MSDLELKNRYLMKQISSVIGYLAPVDALLIAALDSWQKVKGVSGDLLEFGVHHGQLYYLLAACRRDSLEKALAVDLFEDGAGNPGRHAGRGAGFATNRRRLGIVLKDDEVLCANTLGITVAILRERIGDCRLISVDAGHEHDEVINDMELAMGMVSSDGAVVADDYFNINWPGVTTAVNNAVESGRLTPFMITPGKMYLHPAGENTEVLYRSFIAWVRGNPSFYMVPVKMPGAATLYAVRLTRRGKLLWKMRRLLGIVPLGRSREFSAFA